MGGSPLAMHGAHGKSSTVPSRTAQYPQTGPMSYQLNENPADPSTMHEYPLCARSCDCCEGLGATPSARLQEAAPAAGVLAEDSWPRSLMGRENERSPSSLRYPVLVAWLCETVIACSVVLLSRIIVYIDSFFPALLCYIVLRNYT